jgi:hypothetical protein
MKNEKKTPLLPMTIINRFERSFGTFKGGGGKNPLHQHTGSICPKKKNKKKPLFQNLKINVTMGWMLA